MYVLNTMLYTNSYVLHMYEYVKFNSCMGSYIASVYNIVCTLFVVSRGNGSTSLSSDYNQSFALVETRVVLCLTRNGTCVCFSAHSRTSSMLRNCGAH